MNINDVSHPELQFVFAVRGIRYDAPKPENPFVHFTDSFQRENFYYLFYLSLTGGTNCRGFLASPASRELDFLWLELVEARVVDPQSSLCRLKSSVYILILQKSKKKKKSRSSFFRVISPDILFGVVLELL